MSGSEIQMDEKFPLCSLKNMAIDTIVENVASYKELIQRKISPPMRQVVLDTAMERIQEIGVFQIWAALPYLDPHMFTEQISTRDFPTIFHVDDSIGNFWESEVSMEEFLQFIVKFAPNLRELDIEDPSNFWKSWDRKFLKQTLEPSSIKQICLMQNLMHISFKDIFIRISDFFDICTELKNLQYIAADNILCELEPDSTKMLSLNWEALNSQFDHQEFIEHNYTRKICIILKKVNSDEPHRLAYASLRTDFINFIPPNLTHLYINSYEYGLSKCQRKKHCLKPILTRFGASLKKLQVECVGEEEKISLRYILEQCSNLEVLYLDSSFVANDDEDLTSFRKLKSLRWSVRTSRDRDLHLLTISVQNILSLPLLEELNIEAYVFDFGDKENLFERIRNREILTNLRELTILDHTMDDPDDFQLFELADEIRSAYPFRVDIIIHTSRLPRDWYN
ncbi:Hypothetical predicted protein [Cloeon dipterum]|uniref:Uncharacterized protein n=1 Tax=Cloeon dipterum TaxID=197152 RepID=A0A8S1DNF9_9INSE|nr:Hypothetical predicted protein [Cloeon dipterum]